MTDRQTYKSASGAKLTLRRQTSDSLMLDERLFLMVDVRGLFIPSGELLAMIDAADPDAMRAYLRETVEASDPAAVVTPEQLDAVPEADGPDDVDWSRAFAQSTSSPLPEYDDVPLNEALLNDAQERRLFIIERLTKTLPADETPALAHWIITGGLELDEYRNIAGEVIDR